MFPDCYSAMTGVPGGSGSSPTLAASPSALLRLDTDLFGDIRKES